MDKWEIVREDGTVVATRSSERDAQHDAFTMNASNQPEHQGYSVRRSPADGSGVSGA